MGKTSMVIRPVSMNDLDDIVELASKTDPGLTSLPHSKEHIRQKIENSLYAFSKTDSVPLDECYLLVLENCDTGKVVGTSGVVAAVGSCQPFYTYKMNTEIHYSKSLDIYKKTKFLTLTNDFTDAAELCTLFLSPDFRGGGSGLLLSKSRFLLMAQYPERFGDNVIAEMRGVSDRDGHSPFWENVGRHFFGIDFETADKANGEGNQQFIAELIPHHPIYVPMLSKKAQAVLGKVHPHTKPALKLLKAEGFYNAGYLDIFDAGPTIEAPLEDILSVKQSRLYQVKIGHISHRGTSRAILSNTQLESFRACIGRLEAPQDNQITINKEQAKALQLNAGELVRVRFY